MPKSSLPTPLQRDQKQRRLRSAFAAHVREFFVKIGLGSSAAISILTTFLIILVLALETQVFFTGTRLNLDLVSIFQGSESLFETVPGIQPISLGEFFGGTQWAPMIAKAYGIWPLIAGTLLITAIAMALALPLGLVTAIYLSEYAPHAVRSTLKPALEILAGIPTVVYGFFALVFLTPSLQWLWKRADTILPLGENFEPYNALAAGLAVGVLCLPIVSSLCEDALQAVPRSLREGAYGLGGTKFDTSLKVVVPAALSGIVSAFLLAIARAIGETMIVALAAGSTPALTADPRASIQTMTGYMVQIASGGHQQLPDRIFLALCRRRGALCHDAPHHHHGQRDPPPLPRGVRLSAQHRPPPPTMPPSRDVTQRDDPAVPAARRPTLLDPDRRTAAMRGARRRRAGPWPWRRCGRTP